MALTDLKQMLDQAVQFHQSGNRTAAMELYREILNRVPDHSDTMHLLGLAAMETGDSVQAAQWIDRAIAIQPLAPFYHVSRARVHRTQGEVEKAIACLKQALALNPRMAEAHGHLGCIYRESGLFDQAILSLKEAHALQPENPDILLNLGVACLESNHREQALDCFRQAIQIQPGRKEAQNIFGCALQSHGKLEESRICFETALKMDPGYSVAFNNLGNTYKAQGCLSEALACFRSALRLKPDPEIHSNLLLALNCCDYPPSEVFAEHQRWDSLYAVPLKSAWLPFSNSNEMDRRLRVGYVSPDFFNHSVAYFIEPVLAAHNHANYEIFCYSDVRAPDSTTKRLRQLADVWRDITPLTHEKAAAQIRSDGIDILVDLAGHTGKNRLMLFARKPAPIQVSWIGYPNTTGLSAIDYRITDEVVDPPGQTEQYHSETLVRLPRNFSCYLPPANSPEVSPLPAISNGFVTLGCFNNFSKIMDQTLQIWAQILNAVPKSRLLLKAKSLGDPGTAQRLLQRLARFDVSNDQVLIDSTELSTANHLAMYRLVDIALDTFPYNGTTTTCEALWMGVPVVALAGNTHVARVGASLLTHLGAPEWITNSPGEYVTRVVELTRDWDALSKIRAGLRAKMRQSSLCDARQFTHNLEETYRWMWKRRIMELSLPQGG